MTDEQINIAIAESLGWTNCRLVIKGAGGGTRYPTAHGMPPNRKYESSCPNYTSDLNAIHEAEALIIKLGHRAIRTYEDLLQKQIANIIFATARQRCEAYLKTIGKWIE